MFLYLLSIIFNLVSYNLLNYIQKKDSGSDHYFHLKLIDRIRKNGNKYVRDYVINKNEKNPFYPQLFHCIISYFSRATLIRYSKLIDLIIFFIEVIIINIFLINYFDLNYTNCAIFNILYSSFPFTYIPWNAKNMGISPRQFGLTLGRIFTFLVIIYSIHGNIYYLICIICLYIIIILSSQFTFQYTSLIILIFSFITGIFELLLVIPISITSLLLFDFSFFRKYFIGQFYHKYNFCFYVSKYYFKERNSIYKDFFYNFWIYIYSKPLRKSLMYIKNNPLIEVVYGFPLLIFLIYEYNYDSLSFNYIEKLIICTILIFILTSFKYTRFLGEPQRYLEYSIPLICIGVIDINYFHLILILLTSYLLIFINISLEKLRKKVSLDKTIINDLVKFFRDLNISTTVSGNDAEILKYLANEKVDVLRNDPSQFYSNPKYDKYFLNDHASISQYSLLQIIKNWKPEYLILNREFYSKVDDTFSKHYSIIHSVDKYLVFKS